MPLIAKCGAICYICGMSTKEKIIEQAKDLQAYLSDDVETIFLPYDVTSKLLNCTDPVEEGKKLMSPIEKEWYELIETFIEELDGFICDYED